MKSFAHWTPRYITARIAHLYYKKRHPDVPWLTRTANEILDTYLTRLDIGLEFGSGRSTVWFANRIARLTSVEHNEDWAANVREMLNRANIKNVDYRFLPKDKSESEGSEAAYVRVIDGFDANSLDFCLVDGAYRDFCALKVMDKIRPGGVLIIDNINRYLPCRSYSPESRSPAEGPKGAVWKDVAQRISGWRYIWTTCGIGDTGFFFKPCTNP